MKRMKMLPKVQETMTIQQEFNQITYTTKTIKYSLGQIYQDKLQASFNKLISQKDLKMMMA